MPLAMAKTAGRLYVQRELRSLLSSQPVEALPLGWRVPRGLERDLENFLALEDKWPAYRHWETNGKKKLSPRLKLSRSWPMKPKTWPPRSPCVQLTGFTRAKN
jgi:hypothetical protein